MSKPARGWSDPKLQKPVRRRKKSWGSRKRRFSHLDVDRSNPTHQDGPVIVRKVSDQRSAE